MPRVTSIRLKGKVVPFKDDSQRYRAQAAYSLLAEMLLTHLLEQANAKGTNHEPTQAVD